jgi:DNA-directed RNA polymerase subunit RPC12/RpoP
MLTSIKTISFCTYKASGDDDFTIYGFTEGCKYKGSSETDDEYILTFTWDSYTRVPLNLESKYYSKSMDDKYRNHTRKNIEIMAAPVEKKYFCQICGAEVDEYSANIQMADGKPVICKNCMKKTIEKS